MYEDEIARVLSAGIPPIDFQVAAIRRCDTDEARGYVTRAVINSLDLGTLTPADYLRETDADAVGLALLARMIRKSLALIGAAPAEDTPAPVTVHTPLSLLSEKEPDRWLSSLIPAGTANPQALCLCFDARLLTGYGTGARDALLRLKRSGVALAVSGCGADDIPLAPLLHLPIDYAFLSPQATALAGDRLRHNALSGLVAYLTGMGQAVIAEGVTSEGQLRLLDHMECFGYLPTETFLRHSGRGSLWLTPGEVPGQTGGGNG